MNWRPLSAQKQEVNEYGCNFSECVGNEFVCHSCDFGACAMFQISGEKEIDISDKPSGIYLLRIIEGDEVRSVVVVKL